MSVCVFFFFKQKTAYEMRISDWVQTCALPIYARDGQGDDGHRRGRRRRSRARGGAEGDRQPAARRRVDVGRQGRHRIDRRRRGHATDGGRRGRDPYARTGRARREHHLGKRLTRIAGRKDPGDGGGDRKSEAERKSVSVGFDYGAWVIIKKKIQCYSK